MIRLIVEDYCQSCGHFEPESDTFEYLSFNEPPAYDTNVFCKRRHDCERIYEHLKKEAKKE